MVADAIPPMPTEASGNEPTPENLAKRVLRREWQRLSARERGVIERVLARMAQRQAISRDTDTEFRESRTFGERLADRIAAFGGAWTVILRFLAFRAGGTCVNTEILAPRREAFDPYPTPS
jgi:uncharacterized membrane protein